MLVFQLSDEVDEIRVGLLFRSEIGEGTMAGVDDQGVPQRKKLSEGGFDLFGLGDDEIGAADGSLEQGITREEGVVIVGKIADASFRVEGRVDDLDVEVLDVQSRTILGIDRLEVAQDFLSCHGRGVLHGVADEGFVGRMEIDGDAFSGETFQEGVDATDMIEMGVGQKDSRTSFVMLFDVIEKGVAFHA